MPTRELAPIRDQPKDFDEIEKRILAAFRKLFYKPLLEILKLPPETLQNSIDTLVDAIRSGRITFDRGVFRGKFSAEVSRQLKNLGASWDKGSSSFKITRAKLPENVLQAIDASESKFKDKLKAVDRKLEQILPTELAESVKTADLFDAALWKVDKRVNKTLQDITILPKLTLDQRHRLSTEWQNNLEIYIKDFTTTEILRLRKQIFESANRGYRYESLVKDIEKSFGVSARKAKFLARQETSLFMAKFKETRYESAGITTYKWRCVAGSKNHPVRPAHRLLDGTIQTWSNPPRTTPLDEPARYNNPGQDYNCRCMAIPIVKFKETS